MWVDMVVMYYCCEASILHTPPRHSQTVHRDEIRVSSPRSIGPTIDDGPFAVAESVSMQPAASDRPYDVQELTTTTGHQSVSTAAEHSALALMSQGGNQVVARCVDLLQRDPDVQVPLSDLNGTIW